MESLPGYDAWKTREPDRDYAYPPWDGEVEFSCPVPGCPCDHKWFVALDESDDAFCKPIRRCIHPEREAVCCMDDEMVEAADAARATRDCEHWPEREYDHEEYLLRKEGYYD
jgi:hypothetical protein